VTAVEGAAYTGPDGVRRYFADMAEAWHERRNEPRAVPVELENPVAFLIEAGRIVRCVAAATREDALDGAAGRKP
jgi:hypothetical protein